MTPEQKEQLREEFKKLASLETSLGGWLIPYEGIYDDFCLEWVIKTVNQALESQKREIRESMNLELEDWKDSYKGKLWSSAVEKCFKAPFIEVAIQYLLKRIDEKHQEEIKSLQVNKQNNE